jgi:hypothetical protein
MKHFFATLPLIALCISAPVLLSAQDLAGGLPAPAAQHGVTTSCSLPAQPTQPSFGQLMVNGQRYLTIKESGSAKIDSAVEKSYIPVSRKEYLQQAKAELTAMTNSIVEGWKLQVRVRPAAVQEAEKKANIDQLKAMYTGIDLEVRMRIYLHNYKTDEQYLKENTDKETAGPLGTLRLIDGILAHMSATELSKPAIISVSSPEFQGFEDGKTDNMLIRMDAAHSDNSLSEGREQELLVSMR